MTGISPGLVDTDFFSVRADGDESKAREATSAIRPLEAADVARAVVWALSAPAHVEVNDIVLRPAEQVI